MLLFAQRIGAFSAAMVLSVAPVALAQTPFQLQNLNRPNPVAPSGITTPESRAASDTMLSTKPAGNALPWQAPPAVQVTAPGAQATPAPIPAKPMPMPFGRSTASQYEPIPEGPHTTVAVPVENIEMIEAGEPAPATPAAPGADPANEDPAAPTELTAPMFKPQIPLIPRMALVNVLNKVTARAERVSIKPGEMATVGKLQIIASHCQLSAEGSLPDAAALLEISEIIPNSKEPKLLFTGWMYQSSPSVSALEHPVYDVTLLNCKDTQAKADKVEKPKKTKKK